jgi:hypothetical protein
MTRSIFYKTNTLFWSVWDFFYKLYCDSDSFFQKCKKLVIDLSLSVRAAYSLDEGDSITLCYTGNGLYYVGFWQRYAPSRYTDKKRKSDFPHIKGNTEWSSFKVIYDLRPPQIWGNICAFPHIIGSPSSYMTLQLLHSEFPFILRKFDFLFHQCSRTSYSLAAVASICSFTILLFSLIHPSNFSVFLVYEIFTGTYP